MTTAPPLYRLLLPALLILAGSSTSVNGQAVYSGFFWENALGYSSQRYIDDFNSSRHFQSHTGHLHMGFYWQKDYWQQELAFGMGGGLARPVQDPELGASQSGLLLAQVRYAILFRIWRKPGHSLWLGLSNENDGQVHQHNRFSNSAESFTALFSYGPYIRYQNDFLAPWVDWHMGYRAGLMLPVGSYALRPGLVQQLADIKPRSRRHLPGYDSWHLHHRSEIFWFLANGNRLGLGYQWGYQQLSKPHTWAKGQHYFFISSVLKL